MSVGAWRRVLRGLGVGLVLVPAGLAGQGGIPSPPAVAVRVTPARATVGDRLTVEVAVAYAPGDSIGWPADTGAFGPFEILGREPAVSAEENGRARSVRRYTVAAFELGDLELAGVAVEVVSAGGDRREVLEADPVPVPVGSVGRDETGDIRDIKPPREIPRNWLLLLPWVALLGLVAAVAWWAWRRRRRPGVEPMGPVAVAPARPAEEVALEAFDRLLASSLLERGELKAFYSEASGILRRYLEARFGVDAMEMASADILERLRGEPEAGRGMDRFTEFFRRADLVKFAKARPGPAAARDTVEIGRGLVLETRRETVPAPEPAEVPG